MNQLIKINWIAYLSVALLIWLLFPSLSVYSYIAVVIFVYQVFLLFFSFNYLIPIRYLFGSLMCLQLLLGPVFAYNGLDKYIYSLYAMRVPEDVYFSYIIPAVLFFIFGLNINTGKLKGEVIDENSIRLFVEKRPQIPIILIIVGFLCSLFPVLITSDFSTTDAVGARGGVGWLTFIFYLLGCLKFIGAFMLILGKKGMKILPAILVYGSIVVSSLSSGMFHDLLIWIIMVAAIVAIRYKPSVPTKLIFAAGFVILAFTIQAVKANYRTIIYGGSKTSGVNTFTEAIEESESGGVVFSPKSLAVSNIRINQGFIITNILKTVPEKVPYADGDELGLILEAAFLPRYLAPEKLEAGDQKLFNKYTQLGIAKGTSMGLSSVGDAYVNFGIIGGCIFMFLLGLIYNQVLKLFHHYSKTFPVLLLFVPLVFYYPIRPDCELQTSFGHVVRACFFIILIFTVWKNTFKFQQKK